MHDDLALSTLSRRVGERLASRGMRLSTAESCTGGLVAKLVTDIAGSSAWFERGWVTYANSAKVEELGVPATTLVAQGAVSEAVVRAMAEGALSRSECEVALAVSGVAGPGGGTPGKPVGTVWFAWALRHGKSVRVQARTKLYKGDRDTVRRKAARDALQGVLEVLGP